MKKIIIICFAFIGLNINLFSRTISYQISNHEEKYTLIGVTDNNGDPVYYYRDFEYTEGTRKIKFRIYWDILGRYMQFEIPSDENLQKVNQKNFNENDYIRLHQILNNPTSDFKNCQYAKKSEMEVEQKYYEVDAISGASKKAIKIEYVKDAIKISCLCWQAAYGHTTEKIKQLTREHFSNFTPDKTWVNKTPHEQAIYFYNLYLSSTTLDEKQLESISHHISNTNGCSYNLIIAILDRQQKKSNTINEEILKQLENSQYYIYCLTYNYILTKHLKKELKDKTIQYKNIRFF